MATALLVIDVQIGILEGPPAIPDAQTLLRNVAALVASARDAGTPVIFVQHDGRKGHRVEVGSRGWPIHPDIAPREGEPIVHKRECDAFYETELERVLREHDITSMIVAGLMTEFCVDTTCRRAFSLGYDVTLVADAHSTADNSSLSAAQIVAHHNETLDGFGDAPHELRVRPLAGIRFG